MVILELGFLVFSIPSRIDPYETFNASSTLSEE